MLVNAFFRVPLLRSVWHFRSQREQLRRFFFYTLAFLCLAVRRTYFCRHAACRPGYPIPRSDRDAVPEFPQAGRCDVLRQPIAFRLLPRDITYTKPRRCLSFYIIRFVKLIARSA